MFERTTDHKCHLRPVTRDADTGERRALPLLRAVWEGSTCEAWMLWCTTCRKAVEGTALADTADCDIEDLRARMVEVGQWEQECRTLHQFTFDA